VRVVVGGHTERTESTGSGCKDNCGCNSGGGQYFTCSEDWLDNPTYKCYSMHAIVFRTTVHAC